MVLIMVMNYCNTVFVSQILYQMYFHQTTSPFLQLNIGLADLMRPHILLYSEISYLYIVFGFLFFFSKASVKIHLAEPMVASLPLLVHHRTCHDWSGEVGLWTFWERVWLTERWYAHCDPEWFQH